MDYELVVMRVLPGQLQRNVFSSLYSLVYQLDGEDLAGYSQKLLGDAGAM